MPRPEARSIEQGDLHSDFAPGYLDPAELLCTLRSEMDIMLKACHEELFTRVDERLEMAKDNIVERLQGHETLLGNHSDMVTAHHEAQLRATEDKIIEKLHGLSVHPLQAPLMQSSSCTGKDREESVDSMGLLPEADPHAQMEAQIEELLDLEEHDRWRQRRASKEGQLGYSIRSSCEEGVFPADTSVHKLVKHPHFETFFAVTILSNALFIGIQTELAASNSADQDHVVLLIISTLYTIIFTAELALRLHTSRWHFFISRQQWYWNYLDVVVVTVSILETALDLAMHMGSSNGAAGAAQYRVLRILRITRLVRGIKLTRIVRFVRALRVLCFQISSTVKHLVWALMLFIIIIYLFGLVFTQATTEHIVDYYSAQKRQAPVGLAHYWSTLPRSMLTCFWSITGGVSWESAVLPLSDLHPVWVALFVVYVCFMQLAVLNVLTGVFCQNAIESAEHDQEMVTQNMLAEKKRLVSQLLRIFEDIDMDKSGSITIQEFRHVLSNSDMQAYLTGLGLDTSDAWTLFKLIDLDGGNTIEVDEFVMGCLRLRGQAKGVDMAKLEYEHRWMAKRLAGFMRRTDESLTLLTCGLHPKSSKRGGRSTEDLTPA
mmetsp:Transcript_81837/g.212996  ORF Transcript_81837/g.212996 Transcript_81837/m.212996 type:complete len:603 (+) Transcript_81837:96-1904(+)